MNEWQMYELRGWFMVAVSIVVLTKDDPSLFTLLGGVLTGAVGFVMWVLAIALEKHEKAPTQSTGK